MSLLIGDAELIVEDCEARDDLPDLKCDAIASWTSGVKMQVLRNAVVSAKSFTMWYRTSITGEGTVFIDPGGEAELHDVDLAPDLTLRLVGASLASGGRIRSKVVAGGTLFRNPSALAGGKDPDPATIAPEGHLLVLDPGLEIGDRAKLTIQGRMTWAPGNAQPIARLMGSGSLIFEAGSEFDIEGRGTIYGVPPASVTNGGTWTIKHAANSQDPFKFEIAVPFEHQGRLVVEHSGISLTDPDLILSGGATPFAQKGSVELVGGALVQIGSSAHILQPTLGASFFGTGRVLILGSVTNLDQTPVTYDQGVGVTLDGFGKINGASRIEGAFEQKGGNVRGTMEAGPHSKVTISGGSLDGATLNLNGITTVNGNYAVSSAAQINNYGSFTIAPPKSGQTQSQIRTSGGLESTFRNFGQCTVNTDTSITMQVLNLPDPNPADSTVALNARFACSSFQSESGVLDLGGALFGAEFPVIRWGARSGTFESVVGSDFGNGVQVTASYRTNGLFLVAAAAPAQPRFSAISRSGSNLSLSLPTVAGNTYLLEGNEALGNNHWLVITNWSGDGAEKLILLPLGAEHQRYLRLRVQ